MKTCINSITYEEFLAAKNGNNRHFDNYENYLKSMDDETLFNEWRVNHSLREYLEYRYNFLRSRLFMEVINPSRIVSDEGYYIAHEAALLINRTPKEMVEKFLFCMNSISRFVRNTFQDFDPDMFALPSSQKEERETQLAGCLEDAYFALDYYYALKDLDTGLNTQRLIDHLVLGGKPENEKEEKLESSIREKIMKEGYGITSEESGENYRKCVGTHCHLNEIFQMIEN